MNAMIDCAMCGRVFVNKYKPSQKFCSRECAAEFNSFSKRETRICPCCGKEFIKPKSDPDRYCSQSCGAKMRKGVTHPNRRRPQNFVTMNCVQCGKSFTVHKVQTTGKRKRQFCSRVCQGLAYRERKRGAGNSMFKGGGYSNLSRGASWHKQRKAAYARDGATCQICGKRQRKGQKAIVDVHHIKPFRLFNGDHDTANQLSNLITLCKQCHAKAESGLIACPQKLL